jgi:hypothetical protein
LIVGNATGVIFGVGVGLGVGVGNGVGVGVGVFLISVYVFFAAVTQPAENTNIHIIMEKSNANPAQQSTAFQLKSIMVFTFHLPKSFKKHKE